MLNNRQMMDMFLESGNYGEVIIEYFDTKLAIWTTLLPASKEDSLRSDGSIDEIMFVAHMIAVATINAAHRPFSSLSLCTGEMSTQALSISVRYTAQTMTRHSHYKHIKSYGDAYKASSNPMHNRAT
jgi:hypothetical protein